MKKREASAIIYIIFFLTMFLAFSAFAVDGAIVLTNRIKLQNITEQTALSAASEFNSSSDSAVAVANANVAVTAVFNILRLDSLRGATVNASFPTTQKVCVSSDYVSQPFFLAFLGVTGINLEANACAQSETLNVTPSYGGINWVTPATAFLSDIVTVSGTFNDTAILFPLGNEHTVSYDSATDPPKFGLLNSEDDEALSLGPGGYLTVRMPAPLVNKSGNDFYIKEAGDAMDGYKVFAGMDVNPDNPYTNKDKPGDGVLWVDITSWGGGCDLTLCYGSSYFNIDNHAGLSVIKYLRIVDDNSEIVKYSDGNFYNAYGEASTATAGADIDVIRLLNHVKLVSR